MKKKTSSLETWRRLHADARAAHANHTALKSSIEARCGDQLVPAVDSISILHALRVWRLTEHAATCAAPAASAEVSADGVAAGVGQEVAADVRAAREVLAGFLDEYAGCSVEETEKANGIALRAQAWFAKFDEAKRQLCEYRRARGLPPPSFPLFARSGASHGYPARPSDIRGYVEACDEFIAHGPPAPPSPDLMWLDVQEEEHARDVARQLHAFADRRARDENEQLWQSRNLYAGRYEPTKKRIAEVLAAAREGRVHELARAT